MGELSESRPVRASGASFSTVCEHGPGCCVSVLLSVPAAGAEPRGAGSIPVSSMLLKLVEQVDVPARETGVLASVEAREGQLVRQGELLAQIDDTEAKIAEEQAKIDIEIAQASASNDVNLRFAKKSVEVAKAELRRSDESNEKYPRSVSESEVDRLRLLVEKSSLEVEQAEHEYAVAKLMLQAKEGEYRLAQQKAQRHQVPSPLDGIVVQVYRHRGEWVKPGEAVVRILRMDRLRAEGFVKAELAGQHLQGRAVRLVLNGLGSPAGSCPAKSCSWIPKSIPSRTGPHLGRGGKQGPPSQSGNAGRHDDRAAGEIRSTRSEVLGEKGVSNELHSIRGNEIEARKRGHDRKKSPDTFSRLWKDVFRGGLHGAWASGFAPARRGVARCVLPDRRPNSAGMPGLIHVDTPKRGRIHICSANHTAINATRKRSPCSMILRIGWPWVLFARLISFLVRPLHVVRRLGDEIHTCRRAACDLVTGFLVIVTSGSKQR